MEKTGEILKLSDIAKELQVDRTTVFRWIKKGTLKTVPHPGKSYRVARKDLDQFIKGTGEFTLVIIDDEPSTLELLKIWLTESSLPVDLHTFTDELTAMLQIREIQPDLLIIDQNLPDVVGTTLGAKIRALPNMEDTPIIIISGQEEDIPPDKNKFDIFIRKPFSWDKIRTAINSCIRP